MLVYNKVDGTIVAKIPKDQSIKVCFYHYPDSFKDNLVGLSVSKVPPDLENYKVVNNQIVRRTTQEIEELYKYGKVLTNDEQLLESIKPTSDEIRKAETIVEVLSILEGVL